MNRFTRYAIAVGGAVGLSLGSATSASAMPSGDPDVVRTANPAHACAAVPGTLAQFGVTLADFDYPSCVRELAGRVPLTAFGGDPYARCAELEAGVYVPPLGGVFTLVYPYTFHGTEGDPFPDLRAYDREQCARALWVFHEIESHLSTGH